MPGQNLLLRCSCVCLLVLAAGLVLGEQPPSAKPPWQRLLQGDDAKKAQALEKILAPLQAAGKLEEALKVAEELTQMRARLQGADHWQAVNARQTAEALRRASQQGKEAQQQYAASFALARQASALQVAARYREAQPLLEKVLAARRQVLGEEHPDTAAGYNTVAFNLNAQGRYKEAEEGYRKALDIRRKVLGEEHPATAASYNNVAFNLQAQGRYLEAEEGLRKALAINRKLLGEEHPDTASSYNNVAFNLNAQARYQEAEKGYRKALAIRRKVLGEEHPDTAQSYNNVAFNLNALGQYKEAEEGYRKALDIYRKVLGEEHPATAASYNNVALNLNAQGRYQEAEKGLRKALTIWRKLLGEEHADTATGYNNLAANIEAQGRYPEAEAGYRKALAIRRKVLGEMHSDTADSYNNLAANMAAQGRYQEAEEGYRKALDIRRKVLGEEHPDTAQSYNNVAGNLEAQGRYPEAGEGYRKALDIRIKVLGEAHPDTATSYNNVAFNLNALGRYKEAEEGYRKALDIRRKALGEEHPAIARGYNNLAYNLEDQGRYKEAEEGYRKALDINRKMLGEEHPDIAQSYNNLAYNLVAQGRYQEAEEGLRKALAICRKVLGEEHPLSARTCNILAASLHAQGRYREAEQYYLQGANVFLASRLHLAASGLGRATKTSEHSPLFRLAAVLARNGKPAEAWHWLEQGLGRGAWDDLSARLRRTPAEQLRQAELTARLERLDLLLAQLSSRDKLTAEQKKQREDLLDRRLQAQAELSRFGHDLESKYGPVAGKVFERKQIQATLPADTAMLCWIDLAPAGPRAADPDGEHWAVLLRSQGEPLWQRLHGSGPKEAWTEADTTLPGRLCTALHSPGGNWSALAEQLRRQRLEPLAKDLAATDQLPAVRHLVVLPSPLLQGVPVEVLAEGYTVSYGFSGTLYAHLRSLSRPKTEGLFALGDPIFDKPAATEKDRLLPPHGVLLTVVQPGSNAFQSGLRANDVLLQYGGKDVQRPDDLKTLLQAAEATRPVPVMLWRNGDQLRREVRPGKLGVVLADKPAPEALAELRRLDRRLASRSGDDGWQQLPGTRYEVEALHRLFGDKHEPLLLFDSEASQQRLEALAKSSEQSPSGRLGQYRYLHLATHGEVDDAMALRSALILSRDQLPDPRKQLEAGLPIYDGRLSARQMLEQWHLDAALVTLSACQTALGKYERGEGFIGFAHALMLCGSRSVCLSLWKVDDAATALLMERFYQNVLGKRQGLKAPMRKAAALREAKEWLRSLSREEALKHAARVSQGVARGKDRPRLPLLPAAPESAAGARDDKPYAHPYYWAAFVLIGDPD
jgi:tetratricopeptide (TPR) repeat protein